MIELASEEELASVTYNNLRTLTVLAPGKNSPLKSD